MFASLRYAHVEVALFFHDNVVHFFTTRWGFLQWRANVRVCLEEKEQEKKAQHQHKLILLKKVKLRNEVKQNFSFEN